MRLVHRGGGVLLLCDGVEIGKEMDFHSGPGTGGLTAQLFGILMTLPGIVKRFKKRCALPFPAWQSSFPGR